ncbi:MAG: putative lipid flippase FtsW [Actinomycetota bacterium]
MTSTAANRSRKLSTDYVLLIGITTVLCAFGLAMVVSASGVFSTRMTGNAWSLSLKQFGALLLGLAGAYFLARTSLNQLKRLSIFYGLIVLVSLVAVLFIGTSVGGQRNWIDLAGIMSYQPSEFAKLSLVLFGAWVFASGQTRDRTNQSNNLLLSIVAGAIMLLVLLEGDLGTPIILGGITLAIFFAHGLRKRWIALFSGLGALAVLIYAITGPSYRLERFQAWLSPESFPSGLGWQFLQGQYSLASGGLFGKGIGHSTGKWGSLPAAHTDFILSVVGEELGVFGTLLTLLLLVAFIMTALSIAFHASDDFSRMAAFGIAAWFMVQTFINVGAIVQLVPITGVPLPFISYGGSSMIACLLAVGVLASLARNNSQIKEVRSRD